LSTTRFRFQFKRWQKAAFISVAIFLISIIDSYLQSAFWKFAFAIILLILAIGSFFWLEKREDWRRRIAKYSLPFALVVITAGYFLIFPPSLFSYGVAVFSAVGFYFFASRLKIPLPYNVREEVTYYWLDLVIFWVAFLSFFVSYYFLFYLLNIIEAYRFLSFSVILLIISFYLIFFSLWARNRHLQESIFYSLIFDLALAEFLFIWSFFKMSPIGGGLIFVLIFYFFLETLNTFFKYQFVRQKDIIRLVILILILGAIVMFIFKPFTVTTI